MMAESNARAQQAEFRRQQLLDVALDVFAARGTSEVSMRDLATQAGVAAGLSYHYFPSKEALVRAVVARENPTAEITAILDKLDGRPVRQGLIALVTDLADLLADKRRVIRIIFQELAAGRTGVLVEILQFREFVFGRLGGYLTERIEAGELEPHDQRAAVHLLISSILISHALGQPLSPDAIVDTLLRGIQDRPLASEQSGPVRDR
jgi:AcrR family transcriptional regulator